MRKSSWTKSAPVQKLSMAVMGASWFMVTGRPSRKSAEAVAGLGAAEGEDAVVVEQRLLNIFIQSQFAAEFQACGGPCM